MRIKCEETRDRFSALWENELNPSEEQEVRLHLDHCSECRGEFSQFDRTLRMLHSIEERDVPEGFIAGIYERMQRGEKNDVNPKEKMSRWNVLHPPLRLPVQAFAMVAIVFLTLYLTKWMPEESLQTRVQEELKPPAKERIDSIEKPSMVENRKPAPGEVPGAPAVSDQAKRPEGASTARPSEEDADIKKALGQSAGESPEAKARMDRESLGAALKIEDRGRRLPGEVVLRTSDPEKTISEIRRWVQDLGGETLKTEENAVIVSLPDASVSQFKRQLEKREASGPGQKMASSRGRQEDSSSETGVRKRGAQDRDRGNLQMEAARDSRIILRIVLAAEQ